MRNISKARILKAIAGLLVLAVVIGSVVASVFFYKKYQMLKLNPEVVSQEEIKSVTTAIGHFMDLPTDEQPTLATVTDQGKLKDQDFFKNSQNGDKVLIYTKAHKAILYRPSTNRIIEFAPITLGTQEPAPSAEVQTQPVNIAIYNGTTTVGLTAEVEKKLATVNNVAVVAKTNAAKSNYAKTVVYDVSGKNADMAKQIAQILGGDVVNSLPDGEAKPQTDILIIVGK